LLWAINDGGHGPFLYAIGKDGRNRGRIRVNGAENRDWEGLDIFSWRGRAMILIADFGDNKQQHDTHTLYVLPEPKQAGERFANGHAVSVAWRISYSYPDRHHDSEGVAVDTNNERIFVLTKRDDPPILYTLPLHPSPVGEKVSAQRVATIDHIPKPNSDDLLHPYGHVRSQPTALDLSPNGLKMVVLTYKHAYLFSRLPGEDWATAVAAPPTLIQLPLPQECRELRQREALCYAADGRSLWLTSEGLNAGVFQLKD
jgi:hypothetical protein